MISAASNPASNAIDWIGVVVPAHNEQDLLPACLAGLRIAADAVDVPVDVLVVLDSCSDASAAVSRHVATLSVEARNVGVARRTGLARLLEGRPPGIDDDRSWLATTDADTVVPPDWLLRMAAHGGAGWDAVVGTVRVVDWAGRTESVQAAWRKDHHDIDDHPHVHGANLGFRADAYRSVGGMPALALSEDAELVAALESAGRRVYRAGDLPVVTSARCEARAAGGFADYLSELSA